MQFTVYTYYYAVLSLYSLYWEVEGIFRGSFDYVNFALF